MPVCTGLPTRGLPDFVCKGAGRLMQRAHSAHRGSPTQGKAAITWAMAAVSLRA